jgi:IS5 family transposase
MRSPKKKPFSSSRKRSKFKVTNWPKYNNILRNRGRIDFMIAEDLSDGWYEDNGSNKNRGGQRRYSDKAILMCLQIRYLFGLKLRQSQGFINWIFMLTGSRLTCPDYTTLSKRGRKLNLEFLLDSKDNDFDYICMDSTGIQTYTGNEWLENKHGKQYIRRTWKKLHIAIGNNGRITGAITTNHNKDDRSQIEELLKNVRTKEVLADPGYDGENIYQLLRTRGIKPTIRPPNHLAVRKAKTERQQSAEYQQTKGYHAWRSKNKYGRRELAENAFFRFKGSFGSKFLSRGDDNMKNEMTIKCQLLNKMFEIGKPISVRIA